MIVGIVVGNKTYADRIKNTLHSLYKEDDVYVIDKNFDKILKEYFDILFIDTKAKRVQGEALGRKLTKQTPYTQIIYLDTNDEKELLEAYAKAKEAASQTNRKYITISWRKVIHHIDVKDILWIERDLRKSIIHTHDINYYTSLRIDAIEAMLDESFVRSHYSFITNMSFILSVGRKEIVLKDKKTVPISRSYYKAVIEKYRAFKSN